MKRTILYAISAIAISSHAFAWTAATHGSGPQAIGQDGGSASAQQQRQSASSSAASSATANSASRSAGGSVTIGQIGGGGNGAGTRAPDINLPSFGGGGMDCPTVGFGASGAGLGGGGGFGPSWISTDCNNRKLAELLFHWGHQEEAMALLQDTFPQVKRAMTQRAATHYEHPSWCVASTGQWLANLEECGRKDPR